MTPSSESGPPERNNSNSPDKRDELADSARDGEWQLWPPSPKMQIVLIAVAFGLFNFLLLAIWAIVMVKQF